MNDADYASRFYDNYGLTEWRRLERSAYGRLQAVIHAGFVERYLNAGDRVLDIGSGPGRFAIVAARLGGRVTVADLSPRQLDLARDKIAEAGLLDRIEAFTVADVCDLSAFPDAAFDLTICFGGPLSYAGERRATAAAELVRVTKPGGTLLASVMSRYGAAADNVRRAARAWLTTERDTHLWPLIRTGDLPPFPSTSVPGMRHPAMHLYSAAELAALLPGCDALEVAGSNVTIAEGASELDDLAADPDVWATIVEVERALNHQPGLVDSGTHVILAASTPASR
jgi:ubiquinone/menaquinone biosynthesis C-methylase UbiE